MAWQSFDWPMIHQREEFVAVFSWSYEEGEKIKKSNSLEALRACLIKSKILIILFLVFLVDSP